MKALCVDIVQYHLLPLLGLKSLLALNQTSRYFNKRCRTKLKEIRFKVLKIRCDPRFYQVAGLGQWAHTTPAYHPRPGTPGESSGGKLVSKHIKDAIEHDTALDVAAMDVFAKLTLLPPIKARNAKDFVATLEDLFWNARPMLICGPWLSIAHKAVIPGFGYAHQLYVQKRCTRKATVFYFFATDGSINDYNILAVVTQKGSIYPMTNMEIASWLAQCNFRNLVKKQRNCAICQSLKDVGKLYCVFCDPNELYDRIVSPSRILKSVQITG